MYLDIFFILPIVVLLSIVAGVFNKLNRVSVSVILIPSILGFTDFFSFNPSEIIVVLIASTVSASIPLSVFYFVKLTKFNMDMSSLLAKTAARIALLSILISQILSIVPGLYVLYVYWLVLIVLTLGLCAQLICYMLNWDAFSSKNERTSLAYYFGLMSLLIGGVGQEWQGVFVGKNNKEDKLAGFAFLSVFIALPASIGFLLPAIAVPLIELSPSFSPWMLGYICWPLSIVIFMSSTLGRLLVRQHNNLTDIAWLKSILVVYLIASVVRMIMP